MDHLECVRRIPIVLAALVLTAVVAAGCAGTDSQAPVSAGVDAPPTAIPPNPTPPPTATPAPAPTPTGAPEATATPTPTPPPPLVGLDAELVADGFDQPILAVAVPGTDAIVVVEREGLAFTMGADGTVYPDPFLDVRGQMTSSSIEQGLLGLAFHPDYESNGRLFAYWTQPNGDSRLAEFAGSGADPVDPSTMSVVLDVDQPAERHNAGMVVFGPSGLLYVALGDGGSGGTTAQDTSNLLGSILRLDVDTRSPYAIAEGNPFGNEIWVYGLRNPWRFSIDPVDELVYIGDVGQDAFEEINVVGLDGAGTNFGWFEMEGSVCFRGGCNPSDFELPAHEYLHSDACSVTGGIVYRGSAIPELVGHYVYADWCSVFVSTFRYEGGEVADLRDWTPDLTELGQVTSFAVDHQGELLTVNWDGQVHRIIPLR
jgi:glucose/arabinose dehydrogenase